MLRMLSAEFRYNLPGLIVWFTLLLFVSIWPLFEAGGVATALVMFTLFLPFAALSGTFGVLSNARNEKRMRLFRSLPVPRSSVIIARMAAAQAIPLMAAVVLVLALAGGAVFGGDAFLARLQGGWVLASMYFLAMAVCALTVLITNRVSLGAAQLTITVLGVTLLMGFFSEPVLEGVLMPIGDLLQTAGGAAASLALLVLIVAADFVTSARRMPEA